MRHKIIEFFLVFVCIISVTFSACSNSETQSPLPSSETQSPWPNVKVYDDDSQKITVNNGDEFVIRYTTDDIFARIKESHDDTMITLMDSIFEDSPDLSQKVPLNKWFLFKALKTGETQIHIIHYTHEWVLAEKIFILEIN